MKATCEVCKRKNKIIKYQYSFQGKIINVCSKICRSDYYNIWIWKNMAVGTVDIIESENVRIGRVLITERFNPDENIIEIKKESP